MKRQAIGFTGTQDGMTEYQLRMTRSVLRTLWRLGHTELHHGDCVGADAEVHELARKIGFTLVGHPPIDTKKRAFCHFDDVRPPADYISRNHDIVDETGLLIATPRTHEEVLRSGTWSTVRYARRLERSITLITPDGVCTPSTIVV